MERAKKELPLWSKKTTGTLIIRTPRFMRIKYGQKIRATPEELGNRIDNFELLEGDVDLKRYPQVGDEKKLAPKEEYSVEHLGGGWYNVLSPAGKTMNTKKLRSEDAQELKADLEATGEEDDKAEE